MSIEVVNTKCKSGGYYNDKLFRKINVNGEPIQRVRINDKDVYDNTYWIVKGGAVVSDEIGNRLVTSKLYTHYYSENNINKYNPAIGSSYLIGSNNSALLTHNSLLIMPRMKDFMKEMLFSGDDKYSLILDLTVDLTKGSFMDECYAISGSNFQMKGVLFSKAGTEEYEISDIEMIDSGRLEFSGSKDYNYKKWRKFLEIDSVEGYNFDIDYDLESADADGRKMLSLVTSYRFYTNNSDYLNKPAFIGIKNMAYCKTELKEKIKNEMLLFT